MPNPAPASCILVMPAYNEASCIAGQVTTWLETLRRHCGKGFRILVTDDGSTDGTAAILDTLAAAHPELHVRHQENRGHGPTIRGLYEQAISGEWDYVFQADSDGQFDIPEFELLWRQRMRSRFILGLRIHRQDPLHRRLISYAATRLLRLGFGIAVPDANTPFRLMEASLLRQLLPQIPQSVFAPNLFLALAAARSGEQLLHIPVNHHARAQGQGSLINHRLLRAALRSTAELWQYRRRP